MDPLLDVRDLSIDFLTPHGPAHALRGVSLVVPRDRVVGVVGESGSGKTTLISAALNLLPGNAVVRHGSVRFGGREVLGMSEAELRELRGKRIAMVFQDPMTSLNPVLRISRQLEEAMLVHGRYNRKAAAGRAIELLGKMGITAPARAVRNYPHQFSGGMRQRVMIAMALACKPTILLADEPTTALDVTIQRQILELLLDLQRQRGMALILITHNMGVVAETAHRVAVMYAGQVVEERPAAELFRRPRHPYTAKLIAATPRPGTALRALASIPGAMPDLRSSAIPPCRYSPRCERYHADCTRPLPHFGEGGRMVSCWNPL